MFELLPHSFVTSLITTLRIHSVFICLSNSDKDYIRAELVSMASDMNRQEMFVTEEKLYEVLSKGDQGRD